MASKDVVRAVLNGEADDDLRAVYDAFKSRTATLNRLTKAQVLATTKVGDRVMLKDLRPQYLNGLTGTVEGIGERLTVRLDHPQFASKYALGGKVRVPATCLTVMPSDTPAPTLHGVGGAEALVKVVPVGGRLVQVEE